MPQSSAPHHPTALSVIHKYIRLELFEVAGLLSRASATDCQNIQQRIAQVIILLRRHGEQEDKMLEPKLRALNPALANHMAEDHRELEQQLRQIEVLVEDLEPTVGELCERGLARLHLDWMQFVGNYLLHLDDEERLLFPALGPGGLPPVQTVAQSGLAQQPALRERFFNRLQHALNPVEYAAIVQELDKISA